MKFQWVQPPGVGVAGPWFRCAIRRDTKALPNDIFALLDTGADVTTFPTDFAKMLNFSESDPAPCMTNGVGGQTQILRAKIAPSGVGIQIGGNWYSVPALHFAKNVPPLLGRDFLFSHFKIRMEHGETDLRSIA